jgi:hypothetical protein
MTARHTGLHCGRLSVVISLCEMISARGGCGLHYLVKLTYPFRAHNIDKRIIMLS